MTRINEIKWTTFWHSYGVCSNFQPLTSLGSLTSYYGDAEDNVDWKLNLYFTFQSQDTLKSFALFITVKVITKLNLGHSDKFEIEFQNISRRSSRSPDNAECGHFTLLFCKKAKKCTQIYNARAQLLFCSLYVLFSDVPVTIAGVVLLNSLLTWTLRKVTMSFDGDRTGCRPHNAGGIWPKTQLYFFG